MRSGISYLSIQELDLLILPLFPPARVCIVHVTFREVCGFISSE